MHLPTGTCPPHEGGHSMKVRRPSCLRGHSAAGQRFPRGAFYACFGFSSHVDARGKSRLRILYCTAIHTVPAHPQFQPLASPAHHCIHVSIRQHSWRMLATEEKQRLALCESRMGAPWYCAYVALGLCMRPPPGGVAGPTTPADPRLSFLLLDHSLGSLARASGMGRPTVGRGAAAPLHRQGNTHTPATARRRLPATVAAAAH